MLSRVTSVTLALVFTACLAGAAELRILWDMQPAPGTEPTQQWLEEQGWLWGIEVRDFTTVETIQAMKDKGWHVLMHLHAHPETAHDDWAYKQQFEETPKQDFDGAIDKLRAVFGDAVIANLFIEDDSSGVGFSGEFLVDKPKTHAEAYAMFNEYMQEAMDRLADYPDVEKWGMVGYAPTAHHFARHGVEMIIVERTNDDIEDHQTAFAFGRGAAKQFGQDWGMDFSLWWGVFYGCVHELNASLYTRHLWLSWFAGAETYRIEGGSFILGDPAAPLPIAATIDEWATKVKDIDPGTPDVPVAILMAADHGWMTPAYYRTTNFAWNYAKIPYRQGQIGIDGFFGAAFPGAIYAMDPFPFGAYAKDDPPATPYGLVAITPEFAPTEDEVYYAEPPIPFGRFESRNAARQAIIGEKMNISPYRGMGDTRWGNIFDVYVDNGPLDALDDYPVLIVLGQVKMTEALRERLIAYAGQGGAVVIAAGVARPEDGALTGVDLQPELRIGRAWQWGDEAPEAQAFRFLPATPAEGTAVIASTPHGDPVVTKHPLGEGAVYTSLIPWFEAGHQPLSDVALRLFDEVIAPVQPVAVDGLPAEWLSTTGDTHRTVVIANHHDHPWEGTVHVKDVAPALETCTELRSGEAVEFTRSGEGATVALQVAAHDIKVLRWTK